MQQHNTDFKLLAHVHDFEIIKSGSFSSLANKSF